MMSWRRLAQRPSGGAACGQR